MVQTQVSVSAAMPSSCASCLSTTTTSPDGVELLTRTIHYTTGATPGDVDMTAIGPMRAIDMVESIEYPQRADEGDPLLSGEVPRVSFAYDISGLTRTVTNARHEPTTYTLNVFGNPTQIDEPEGRITTMTWTRDAGVTADERADNVIKSRTLQMEDGSLRTTAFAYEYDAQLRVTKRTVTPPGAPPVVTDFDPRWNVPTHRLDGHGVTQSWVYDGFGNLTSHEDGDHHIRRLTYYPPGSQPLNGLMHTLKAPGHTSATTWTYDAQGAVDTVTQPLDGTTSAVTDLDFDERGRLVSARDPRLHATTYHYDALDQATSVELPAVALPTGAPAGLTAGLGSGTQTFTYDDLGQRLTSTDRMGETTTYRYTARGKVKSVSRASGPGTLRFVYDLADNVVSQTDWKGVATTHTYDGLNRRRVTTNHNGDTAERQYNFAGKLTYVRDFAHHVTHIAYDALGRPVRGYVDGAAGAKLQQVTSEYFDSATVGQAFRTVTTSRAPLSAETTSYYYDGRGHLTRRLDPDGFAHVWDYDPDGTLGHQTDKELHDTLYEYDEALRLRRVYSPAQMEPLVVMDYDAAGNVVGRTDARNLTTTLRYDAWNRPYEAEDAAGHVARTLFDDEGRAVWTQDPRGIGRATTRDALGRVTAQYDGRGLASKVESYDANGNVEVTVSRSGRRTRYEYDAEDRLTQVTDGIGLAATDQHISVRRLDAMGHPTFVQTAEQHRRDPSGSGGVGGTGIGTTITYNALYQPTAITDAAGHAEHRTYTQNGLLQELTDRRGFATSYDYDALNRLHVTTNALGETTTTDYDHEGHVTRILSGADVATGTPIASVVEYDDFYRPLRIRHAGRLMLTYGYDAAGNVTRTTDARGFTTTHTMVPDRNLVQQTTNPDGTTLGYEYDAAGHVKRVTNEAGETARFTYDEDGRLATRTTLGSGRAGEPAEDVTTYLYHANGQVNQITLPEMQAGRSLAGRTETRLYDPFDRLERVTQALASGTLATSYGYDHDGALMRVTDPDQDVEYTYDDLGRRTEERQHRHAGLSDLVTRFTEYDAMGNLRFAVDAMGQGSERQYDDLGRLTDYTPPVSATLPAIRDITHVHYAYDANHNLDFVDTTYREQDGTPSAAHTDYTYGNFDELLAVEYERPTDPILTTSFAYDESLNRRRVMSPQGTTSYCFDSRNRLEHAYLGAAADCAAPPAGVAAADYAYTDDGQLASVALPDGSRVDYTYEENTNQLLDVAHSLTGAPSDLAHYHYEHDGNGNLASMRETLEGVEEDTEVTSDALGRPLVIDRHLPDLTPLNVTTLDYEGSFNRQRETIVDHVEGSSTRTYSYEGANRIDRVEDSAAGTIGYTLDPNGNTVARTTTPPAPALPSTTHFTYDGQSQLDHVDVDGAAPVGEYAYDERGRRVRQRSASRDVSTYWDGLSALEERDPSSGAAMAHYRYADRLLSLTEAGSEPQYYHHDGLRNTAALTHLPAGATVPEVVSTYRTDLFGQTREQSGSSTNRHIFSGHENDAETGLVYMMSRYYDPALGRFLTQDSYLGQTSDAPSLNRYTYARGNPGTYWDPDGHEYTATTPPDLGGSHALGQHPPSGPPQPGYAGPGRCIGQCTMPDDVVRGRVGSSDRAPMLLPRITGESEDGNVGLATAIQEWDRTPRRHYRASSTTLSDGGASAGAERPRASTRASVPVLAPPRAATMNGQLSDADAELRARQSYARAVGTFQGALEQFNDLIDGSNSSSRLDQITSLRLHNQLLNESITSRLISIDNARGLLLVHPSRLPGYDQIMANHGLAIILQNAQIAESRRIAKARNFAELMDHVMFALNAAGLLGELSLAVRAGLVAARASGTAGSAMRAMSGIEVEAWRPPRVSGEQPLFPSLRASEVDAAFNGATSEAPLLTNQAARGPRGGSMRRWTPTQAAGRRVYQRDDLIDATLVDARGRTNLERMTSGLAPIGSDGRSINLHHIGQDPDGALVEVTQRMHTQHRRQLHIDLSSGQGLSPAQRVEFGAWRRTYWRTRAEYFAR